MRVGEVLETAALTLEDLAAQLVGLPSDELDGHEGAVAAVDALTHHPESAASDFYVEQGEVPANFVCHESSRSPTYPTFSTA